MTTGFGFHALVRDVETKLVRELGLEAKELPSDLVHLEGIWREQPVRLVARAYQGERVRLARFVEVHGAGLEIGNILCLSRPAWALPILGVDLVEIGRDTAVAVADLSLVASDADERERQLSVLRVHRGAAQVSSSTRELPAWADAWFSPEALVVRLSVERASEVPSAVRPFASAFVELAAGCSRAHDPKTIADRQAAYCAAHREHDRGLQMLRKMFDPVIADRFLREVLFPERLAS